MTQMNSQQSAIDLDRLDNTDNLFLSPQQSCQIEMKESFVELYELLQALEFIVLVDW